MGELPIKDDIRPEQLSKALSEADADAKILKSEKATLAGMVFERNQRASVAESRLAEAMMVIEPFAKAGSMLNFAGATEQDEVELSGEQLHEALRAARRILNEGKE